MAKAKKLPSGSWNVLVYAGKDPDGKRRYESFTAPTKREAEFLAAEFTLKRKDRQAGNITVGEAIDRYIDSKESVLSPSTVREYRKSAARDLPGLRDVKLRDVTQEIIQREISREATTHSPKTVRNMHGLLSAALRMFLPEFSLHTTLPQKRKPEYHTPSGEEIKKLLEAAQGTDMEIPILLAMCGSLRRSEVAALTADDVTDLGVNINKALVQNERSEWVIKCPKTAAGYRFAPLPPQLIVKLRAQGQGRICPLSPDQITRRFHRLLKRNGMQLFRFHDLRHYFASALHALGVPDKYIMLYGGWESETVLHGVYQHVLAEHQGSTEGKVIDYFSGFMQNEKQDENFGS